MFLLPRLVLKSWWMYKLSWEKRSTKTHAWYHVATSCHGFNHILVSCRHIVTYKRQHFGTKRYRSMQCASIVAKCVFVLVALWTFIPTCAPSSQMLYLLVGIYTLGNTLESVLDMFRRRGTYWGDALVYQSLTIMSSQTNTIKASSALPLSNILWKQVLCIMHILTLLDKTIWLKYHACGIYSNRLHMWSDCLCFIEYFLCSLDL